MANDKSTFASNAALDHLLGGAGIYVSLHSGDPGDTGLNEVSGGSYARQNATFSAAASGATANTNELTFSDMPAVTGVAYAGVWDAVTAGNFLYRVNLSTSKDFQAGDTATVAVGDIDITET